MTWDSIANRPAGLDDGDNDALNGLSCDNGEVPVYELSSSSWICGVDNDSNLSEVDVKTIITQAVSLNLDVSTTVGGATILTSDSTLSVDWSNINNRPTGLDDGDDNDSLDTLNCTDGQIAIKENGSWTCTEFSTLLDGDGDGSLQWSDCDDSDENVGDQSNDADCDGVITAVDCDDGDSTNKNSSANDADCDGTATSIDCDDSNPNVTTSGQEQVKNVLRLLVRKFWTMDMRMEMESTGSIKWFLCF